MITVLAVLLAIMVVANIFMFMIVRAAVDQAKQAMKMYAELDGKYQRLIKLYTPKE